MLLKIYTRGNYFIVEDTQTKREYAGLSKNVEVTRSTSESDIFYIKGLKDFDEKKRIKLAEIIDSTDTPFTLEGWLTFYSENTGNFNSAGATAQEYYGYFYQNSDNSYPLNIIEIKNTLGVTLVGDNTKPNINGLPIGNSYILELNNFEIDSSGSEPIIRNTIPDSTIISNNYIVYDGFGVQVIVTNFISNTSTVLNEKAKGFFKLTKTTI